MTLPWGHRALGLSEAEEARRGAWGGDKRTGNSQPSGKDTALLVKTESKSKKGKALSHSLKHPFVLGTPLPSAFISRSAGLLHCLRRPGCPTALLPALGPLPRQSLV